MHANTLACYAQNPITNPPRCHSTRLYSPTPFSFLPTSSSIPPPPALFPAVCANNDFGFTLYRVSLLSLIPFQLVQARQTYFPNCRPLSALSFCVHGLMIVSLGETYFAPLLEPRLVTDSASFKIWTKGKRTNHHPVSPSGLGGGSPCS